MIYITYLFASVPICSDLGVNKMTETFYTLLNCTKNSSFEEIKRNYQQLVKVYHPDKQPQIDGYQKQVIDI